MSEMSERKLADMQLQFEAMRDGRDRLQTERDSLLAELQRDRATIVQETLRTAAEHLNEDDLWSCSCGWTADLTLASPNLETQWKQHILDLALPTEAIVKDDDHKIELKKWQDIAISNEHTIQQILGKALGYPWYKDDQKNFPGATEVSGVNVYDHMAEDLALEVAKFITESKRSLGEGDTITNPVTPESSERKLAEELENDV